MCLISKDYVLAMASLKLTKTSFPFVHCEFTLRKSKSKRKGLYGCGVNLHFISAELQKTGHLTALREMLPI